LERLPMITGEGVGLHRDLLRTERANASLETLDS
jgi:hypothetical protein